MKKTFTKEYITQNCGCYAPNKANKLHSCSFMNAPGKEVSIDEIMNSEIPYQDKFWFIVQHSEMTMSQREKLAKKPA